MRGSCLSMMSSFSAKERIFNGPSVSAVLWAVSVGDVEVLQTELSFVNDSRVRILQTPRKGSNFELYRRGDPVPVYTRRLVTDSDEDFQRDKMEDEAFIYRCPPHGEGESFRKETLWREIRDVVKHELEAPTQKKPKVSASTDCN